MKIVGHRGAKGLAPENTCASLLKALEHHVDEVEFDVRVTADGRVILQHDPELSDPAGNQLTVATSSYAALKKHKPDLATFQAAAQAIDRAVPMLIEVKSNVPIEPIIKDIRGLLSQGWETSDMLLGSFSQKTLVGLHQALPDIQKVVIERWSGTRAVYRARQVGTKRLNMRSWWLWIGFIIPMARHGWELYPYTLNDPVQAKRWASYGIAGVITDYPDRYEI